MIVDEYSLSAAAEEVMALALDAFRDRDIDAVVVGAFGDPGVETLRPRIPAPVIGIGQAAIAQAASEARRFGIATTTPGLAPVINERVRLLGYQHQYGGLRLTTGEPTTLVGERLLAQLMEACELCIEEDGAEAVVIGGGPLGEAADKLRSAFPVPIINAVSAVGPQLVDRLARTGDTDGTAPDRTSSS